VARELGPRAAREQELLPAVDDRLVERVLAAGVRLAVAEEAADIRLVVGEEQSGRALGVEAEVRRELRVLQAHGLRAGRRLGQHEPRLVSLPLPGPGVPEPEGRQHMERRRLRRPVVDGHADEDVVRARLRVLHQHVEVAVVVEHARIDELELGLLAPAPRVLLDQAQVRVLALGVLVERPHVRSGWAWRRGRSSTP
jgi:hypothetical protein